VNALPAQSTGTAAPSKLVKSARKRLERFITLYPRALISDDPEIVHDLRVASRRLQQSLRLLQPDDKSAHRKLFKVLRRARRAFGPSRNLDVGLQLIQAKLEGTTSVSLRHSWEAVRLWLVEKRAGEIERARAELRRHDLIAFIVRAQARIEAIDQEPPENVEPIRDRAKETLAKWHGAFEAARTEPRSEPMHAFRIAGKRLRYQAESLNEIGDASVKKLVQGLKALQDDLGAWRDRSMLRRYVAEFIGRADFLAEEPGMGRALLLEMERDKQQDQAALDEIIAKAEKLAEKWADLSESPAETDQEP
jgi:CHAD domain-containing protein